MIDWIFFGRLLFLPIGLTIGVIAIYFDYTYVGIGILTGFTIPIYTRLHGEQYALTFGFTLAAISLVGFSVSIYYTNKYGMSFQELGKAFHLPKYIRRAPFISVAGLTSSIVTISYCLVRRWWGTKAI